MNEKSLIEQISDQIVKGSDSCLNLQNSKRKNQPGVSELIGLLSEKNVPPPLISTEALDKAMDISIEKYRVGEFLIPDLIKSTKLTIEARDTLAEFASDISTLYKGEATLATMYGEDNTNWRDVAGIFLKGLGFKTIDLGSSVSVNDVIQSVKNDEPDILGITTHAISTNPEINAMCSRSSIPGVKKMIDRLSEEGCRENVKVVFGFGGYVGGIVSAEEIGADYCCNNMSQLISSLAELGAYKQSGTDL